MIVLGGESTILRISLTDACNLRCVYCMPEHMAFQPRHELMSHEELLYLVKIGASLGVNKIRLTGGEPTIRPGNRRIGAWHRQYIGNQRSCDDYQCDPA